MYVRCHSIVSTFQKTLFLEGSKSNGFLNSGLNVTKFKHPLKRYFSGGPFNRYVRRQRYSQTPAVFPNKDLSQLPPKWQQRVPVQQTLQTQETNYNEKPTGTVTIVIDKSDLLASDPNENITIHVKNTPKTPSERLVRELSSGENGICDARCISCQRCLEVLRNLNAKNQLEFHPEWIRFKPMAVGKQSPYISSRSYLMNGQSSMGTTNVRYSAKPDLSNFPPKERNFPREFIENAPLGRVQRTRQGPSVNDLPGGQRPLVMPRAVEPKHGGNVQLKSTRLPVVSQAFVNSSHNQNIHGVHHEVMARARNLSLVKRPSSAVLRPKQESAVSQQSQEPFKSVSLQDIMSKFENVKGGNANRNRIPIGYPVRQPRARQHEMKRSSSHVPLRRTTSIVNQPENQCRTKLPRRSSSFSSIPQQIYVPNQLKQQPSNVVPSDSVSRKRASSLGQRVTNIVKRYMPVKNPALQGTETLMNAPQQAKNFLPQNHLSSRRLYAQTLHPVQAKSSRLPMNNNSQIPVQRVYNLKQERSFPLSNSKQMSPFPLPTKNTIEKPIIFSPKSQPSSTLKQRRPSPPLRPLGTLMKPVPQTTNNPQSSFPYTKEAKRIGSSLGAFPQTKMIASQKMTQSSFLYTKEAKRIGSSLGAFPQMIASQKMPLQNNLTNHLRQKHPSLPLRSPQTTPLPISQAMNIRRPSNLTNEEATNLTMKMSANNSKQLRQHTPLHRLRNSIDAFPQGKIIGQQNVPLQKNVHPKHPSLPSSFSTKIPQRIIPINKESGSLTGKMPSSSTKQLQPGPPLHRLGTSLNLSSHAKNLVRQNVHPKMENVSKGQRLKSVQQAQPSPPFHRLGTSLNLSSHAKNLVRQNLHPQMANVSKSQSLKNVQQAQPSPPFHRLGTSLVPASQSRNMLQRNRVKNSTNNTKNSKQGGVAPPFNGPETSTLPKNIDRNIGTTKRSNILLSPNNIQEVSPAPYPHRSENELVPSPVKNNEQPKFGEGKLLPPPRQPIPSQMWNSNLQSALYVRPPMQNFKQMPAKSPQLPKTPQNPQRNSVVRLPSKPINESNPEKTGVIENTLNIAKETYPSQKISLRSQLRKKMPRRSFVGRNHTKNISEKDRALLPSEMTVLKPNEIDSATGNPAILLCAPRQLKVVDMPVPQLTNDKDVIIKMLYVRLTSDDAQLYASGTDDVGRLTKPTIAGKSGCGIVINAGKEVDNVKVGDQVFVKSVSCGRCSACKNGRLGQCSGVTINEKFGLLTRLRAHPAKFIIKLPNNVNPIDGSMMDELSSAINACKKASITAGDNVMILDGNSLGLCIALAAKSMGATSVCLADTRKAVLEQAKTLGIERLFLINPKSPVSYTTVRMVQHFGGENPRIVFNCNGSHFSNNLAIRAAKEGGKIVLMKNDHSNQPIILSDAVSRGIDILTPPLSDFESEHAALQFISTGKVQLNGFISRVFDLSSAHNALEFLLAPKEITSNILVRCNNEKKEKNDANENSSSTS